MASDASWCPAIGQSKQLHPRPIRIKSALRAGIITKIVWGILGGFPLCELRRRTGAPPPPTTTIVVSVAEQKLVVLRDGEFWRKYEVSTSKFGVGDSFGSYKTPMGHLRVCEKIGEELAPGSVIKSRHATGEVLPANAPGRDPIVTRVIWLDGMEEQNHNARARGVYIHGTTEESKIGKPVSYGCIRMRSKDVEEVFQEVNIDTEVQIIPEKFPHYAKYVPPKPKPVVIVQTKPVPPPAVKPASATLPPAVASAGGAPSVASASAMPPKKTSVFVSTPASAPNLAPTPAPIALYHPPAIDIATPRGIMTTTEISTSALSKSMQGSILSAGLPEGPKFPTLPEPPAPKDVQRFGRLAPNSTPLPEKSVSLQNTGVDIAPAIQAADAADQTRANAAKSQDPSTDSSDKPSSIAFRTGQPDPKAKQ